MKKRSVPQEKTTKTVEKAPKKTKKEVPQEPEIQVEEIKPVMGKIIDAMSIPTDPDAKKNKVNPRSKNRSKTGKEMVIHPALQYLEDFANKNNWKFNKVHQNWILENILNKKSMPKEYFKYAVEYLLGLKGAAKDRLLEECKQAKDAQIEKEKDDLSDQDDEEELKNRLSENTRYKRADVLLQMLTEEKTEQ